MAGESERLRSALESDCAVGISQVIEEKRQEDFEALQALLSLDPSVNPRHRLKAIHALGRWGDPAPAVAICNVLHHLDETGRIRAIDALGRLGTTEALAAVIECADDASLHVRKFVTNALGRINTPAAQAKLRDIESQDSVEYVRTLAAKHLRRAQA